MKVELFKVKVDKLKEVKKQLRKRKCPTKKNLKNLLLDKEEKKRENDILYQSINAIFQDDKNNYETVYSSSNPKSFTSDYHIDLDDLLDSLDAYQNYHLQEGTSASLLITEPNTYTGEGTEENINLTQDNNSMSSIRCSINEDNNNGEQGSEINLFSDVEAESFSISDSNQENLEPHVNAMQFEPDMVELGNYYIPDAVFETINDNVIDIDDICNGIEISVTQDPNNENIDKQVELSEIDNSEVSNLNNSQVEGETNNQVKPIRTEHEVISNVVRGVVMVNPLLVNIPEADLQTMALYHLQQKNDSQEMNNLGETELLKNYSWEQKANIIAAAKMLYIKRTRTLLHWLDPNLSLAKLRATLELSWQNLPHWQKEVYVSQVMGPLVVEASIPMLNPQLKSGDFKMSTPPPEKPQYERKRFADFIINL